MKKVIVGTIISVAFLSLSFFLILKQQTREATIGGGVLPPFYYNEISIQPRDTSWSLGNNGNPITRGYFNELNASSSRFATSTITDLTLTTLTVTAVTTTDLYVSGLLTIGPVAAGNIDGRNYNITDFNLIQANYFWATSTSQYSTLAGGVISQASSTVVGNLNVTATTTSGRLNVGSGKLYVSENGYVGIGTESPIQVLDVAGNIRLRATTGNNELIFIGTGSTYNVISSDESLYFADTIGNYGSYTTPGAGTWGLDKIYDYGATVASAVSIQDDGGLTYFGGNVGIGTTAITHPLTVYGSEMTITATGAATTTISSATSTFAGGLIVDTNSLYVIADTGYVGIGTTTPIATLAVEGQVKATGYRFSNLYLKDDSGELEIKNITDDGYNGIQAVYLKSNSYLTVLGEIQTNTYYDLTIHANDEVDDATERNVILQVLDGTNNAWKTMLTLDPNGASPTVEFGAFNVGIGDTSPDFGLEIGASSTDGYFAVSGGSDGSGNGDKFLIDGNGNVAINTTTITDGSKLNIDGYLTSRAAYGSLAEETAGLSSGWTMTLGAIGNYTGWRGASSTISESSGNITLAGTSNGTATSTITIGTGASGKYQIMYSISLSIDTANQEVHCAVFKNGTRLGRASSEMKMTTVNDVKELSGIGIISLYSNDVIDLRCTDETAADKVITVYHAGLVITRIGLP